MRITGIGVDIEAISAFKRKKYVTNKKFYRRLISGNEISYWLAKADEYESFAGTFCAKEAVLKALQKNNIFAATDIEIIRAETGRPTVRVSGQKCKCFLSISHSGSHAVAFCVAYS